MNNLGKLALYGAIAIMAFSVSACSEPTEEKEEAAAVEINKEDLLVAEYSIDGMVCAMGCAKTIETEIADMSGVGACNVDFESGKAYIEFDKTQLQEKDIIATIEGMADGQYKVNKWEEKVEAEVEVEDIEASEESEETTAEVSLPNFEVPNLFKLLFNQL